MRFRFSRRAEADIREIGDFIARDNPTRAASFIGDLRSRCREIARFPEAAPLRPDLSPNLAPASGGAVRMGPFGAYLIFYAVRDDTVEISRVVHAARDVSQGPLA
jgi:toxin ParE1/3/4